MLDSNLPDYIKYDWSSTISVALGVGGGFSVNLTRESAKQCCCRNGEWTKIVEWSIGGSWRGLIGIGTKINVLGVGLDLEANFSEFRVDFATVRVLLDDCKQNRDVRVDLLNVKINPGIKNLEVGLGHLANVNVSLAASLEFLLGADVSCEGVDWYGGIYVDYDVSVGGAFLWREYSWLSSDDLQGEHTRKTLAEF